ncbi:MULTISPECIES: serine hydrolase [unclassified Streptomyces]|uniref:serine hydrolase n=1 Tax=unclassified Streptomyces TaxID=2593676 RepID=UPI00339F9B95
MSTHPTTHPAVTPALAAIFADAQTEGFVHARDLDGPAEVSFRADEPVVLASVFKIPILLEYARQAAAGHLDRQARHTVTAEYRAGGSGSDGCQYDIELSTRDLAYLMMSVSDNAATDVLLDVVGKEHVRATLDALGFPGFAVSGCRELDIPIRRELGMPDGADFDTFVADADEEAIRQLSTRDPARAPSSTPRDVTRLLAAIWHDQAGPGEACAEVRSVMGRQVWQHRLTSGFEDGVRIAGKTGTEFGIRNEAGVIEYPDGRRYAVAVFLRTRSMAARAPRADAAIGRAARVAVDSLRG